MEHAARNVPRQIDLPNLGAAVIEQWAKLKYGVQVPIMVIPHTFGGQSEF
jgi:hypothetical protein